MIGRVAVDSNIDHVSVVLAYMDHPGRIPHRSLSLKYIVVNITRKADLSAECAASSGQQTELIHKIARSIVVE